MKALEEKILKEGTVLPGHILKVGSFLNQQIDVEFLMEMGREIAEKFKGDGVTKVLTVEASGIAIAVAAAAQMHVPMVFAKKNKTGNVSGRVYSAQVHSYTHNRDYNIVVSEEYIGKDDVVLLVDDFLANGAALEGMIEIVNQAGAKVAGMSCAIEKGFQGGGDKLRAQGYKVESLAIVETMSEDSLTFRK